MKEQRIAYIEWLRVFAAGAVVLMHTAAKGWNTGAVRSGDWAVLTMWESLVRWPVPVFMMITGSLFLPRRTTLGRVVTGYLPRMALAYLLWSGIYALHSGGDFAEKLAAGHYHLWYLPYLCGVYLALPFLQRIVSDEKLERGLLAVSAVVGLFLPWLADVLAWLLPDGQNIIGSLRRHLEFSFFMDCTALVLLGHRLHRRKQSRRERRRIYLLGLIGILITGYATICASRRGGVPSTLFFDFKAPNNLMTAAAIFVFAKYHLKTLPRAAELLARCSFGIYLLHPLIIERLAMWGLTVPALWTPALAAAVFALCAAVTMMLKKIPIVGTYLT